MSQKYIRPPITEAVIDIQFADLITADDVKSFKEKFIGTYPSFEDVFSAGIKFDFKTSQSSMLKPELAGTKMSSPDVQDLILLKEKSLTISRLAPYPGWDSIFDRFTRDWARWKKTFGYRRINRIATRYINRIDIPLGDKSCDTNDYILIGIRSPELIGTIKNYTLRFSAEISAEKIKYLLSSATTQSPLREHASIILDIDVFKDEDAPQKDEEIEALVTRLREIKNRIFEDSITDNSRKLFDTPLTD